MFVDIDRNCWFTSEEEVYAFLENMGIARSSVQTKDSTIDGGRYVKTMICPKPCGNSFLLQYHWYGNEKCFIVRKGNYTDPDGRRDAGSPFLPSLRLVEAAGESQ